jgi:hypothetical protein
MYYTDSRTRYRRTRTVQPEVFECSINQDTLTEEPGVIPSRRHDLRVLGKPVHPNGRAWRRRRDLEAFECSVNRYTHGRIREMSGERRRGGEDDGDCGRVSGVSHVTYTRSSPIVNASLIITHRHPSFSRSSHHFPTLT